MTSGSRLRTMVASSARPTLLAMLTGATLLACARSKGPAQATVQLPAQEAVPEEQNRAISQEELQQDVQRFAGVAMDRAAQAGTTIADNVPPELRNTVLRRVLRYNASVLDIASGPMPEVNLLDMLAFSMLVRDVMEDYWIPQVLGEQGRPLLKALARSEQDINQVAAKLLTRAQLDQMRQLVDQWRKANPRLTKVEGVRLFSLSQVAGELAGAQARRSRGLLASVRSVTRAADKALLLGERAMFLVHRMPFILRLQARLGTQEILGDSLASLGQADELIAQASTLRPLVTDTVTLVQSSERALREAGKLVESLRPMLEGRELDWTMVPTLERVLGAANELTERSRLLLQEVRALAPEKQPPAVAVSRGVDKLVRRWLIYIGLLGALLILLFWGGYIVAKRATR